AIKEGLRHFEVDIAEMAIKSVTLTSVDGRGADDPPNSSDQAVGALSRRLEFATLPEKLEIELDRPYRRGERLTVEISYSCSPRKGLFFVEPDAAYPNKPRQIWSQRSNTVPHSRFT